MLDHSGVSDEPFVDYYDLLQLSPKADVDTIQRIFRHLAKKCHPDLHASNGDPPGPEADRFRLLLEAHKTLTEPATRAAYDARYEVYWDGRWKLAAEASETGKAGEAGEAGEGRAFGDDTEAREKMLSLLYVQRRRNMRAPGLGEYEISQMLRTPIELIEFHVWYLREKDWVLRLDSGQLAISALGVDKIEQSQLRLGSDRLLSARGVTSQPEEEGRTEEK